MYWAELDWYGALLIMFGGRALIDCIKKADANFAVGLGS
jgi:hypothetical protein